MPMKAFAKLLIPNPSPLDSCFHALNPPIEMIIGSDSKPATMPWKSGRIWVAGFDRM
jgi:hypothetical protein